MEGKIIEAVIASEEEIVLLFTDNTYARIKCHVCVNGDGHKGDWPNIHGKVSILYTKTIVSCAAVVEECEEE